MTTPDDLLTPAEAAALAGVQPPTIKQWVRRGKLKPAKEWGEGKNTRRLFWRKDVEALVSRAARPARDPR